jgi:polyisoprenoid-binding protein YceI
MKTIKIFFSILTLALSWSVSAQEWKIGDTYNIAFASKDASGVFKDFSGTVIFDENNLGSSSMKLKIKVESINTGNGIQNKHAKSDEWFDAAKHPYINFESTKIEKTDSGYKAVGKLEIRGVKKDVTIPFTFVKKGSKGTFVAKFSVDRTDYGVGKKGNDVSETIKITATIPVTK